MTFTDYNLFLFFSFQTGGTFLFISFQTGGTFLLFKQTLTIIKSCYDEAVLLRFWDTK